MIRRIEKARSSMPNSAWAPLDAAGQDFKLAQPLGGNDLALLEPLDDFQHPFGVRWSRFPGQFGGKAKMDSGFDYAASFSSVCCIA